MQMARPSWKYPRARIEEITSVPAAATTPDPRTGTARVSFANVLVDGVLPSAPKPSPAAEDEVAASTAISRRYWTAEEHEAGHPLPGHSAARPPDELVHSARPDQLAEAQPGNEPPQHGGVMVASRPPERPQAPKTPRTASKATAPPAKPNASLALGAGLTLLSAAATQAVELNPYVGTPTAARFGGFGGVPCDVHGQPVLRDREVMLPPPEGFMWPEFSHCAFYEHTGMFREAWADADGNNITCSVADRPSDRAPSERCWAFIGSVWDFVQAYPHPIRTQTSHVNCGAANWASWKQWPEKILDGRMLQSAEELLWILCIGDRAAAEQPHTAHESIIGPPTCTTNANQFGCADKSWCWWLRNLTSVAATNIVPISERWEELSRARGSAEERSVRRADTPEPLAKAHVEAWHSSSNLRDVEDGGRPAAQPCWQYSLWREGMHHNFGIFASAYAPVLSDVGSSEATGSRLIIVPIAPTGDGPCVLIPTRAGAAAFGELRVIGVTAKEQAERAAAFISIGIETQHVCTTRNATSDVVVAVPWDRSPVEIATSSAQLEAAKQRGDIAVWCTMRAIQGTPTHEHACMAIQRILAMGGPVAGCDLRVGIWEKARPVTPRRAAQRFSRAPDATTASAERAAFMEVEVRRGHEIQRALCAADRGDGVLISMANDVRTAADFAAELPWPKQGLPSFKDPGLLLHPVPQRPPPLCIDWLHTLPPQAVPDGTVCLPWTQIVRQWGRRVTVNTINTSTAYDDHCFTHGLPPVAAETGLRRPTNYTLGRGAAMQIPHKDGVGTWNGFDIIWERREDGLMYPLDFTPVDRRRWVLSAIKKHIGHVTDREMLSFLFDGVRWKLDAPRQIRISRNLASYGTRAQAVAESMMKVVKRGIFKMVPIAPVDTPLEPDGPCPLSMIPGWEVGCGGVDKPDKPNECRVVGDSSDPHDERLEINRPHEISNVDAASEGRPRVVSFNDLSGPKGGPKEDYDGPLPFPDKEPKPRPRHKYQAGAVLSHYAWLAELFLVVHDDDIRHMFWQFFVAQEDTHLTIFRLIVLIDGVRWVVHIIATSMNMGARNASKIACRFAEEWLDSWRVQMDGVVEQWLPQQTPAFQEAYAERRRCLGFEQARPFWAGVYTDNFDMMYVGATLAAAGIAIWKAMNSEAKIWLAEGAAVVGTCNTWIGGRTVINGGFGCLTPHKRDKAVIACNKALRGELNRDEYESNNSFLSFANDILDFPPGTLRGIAAPLKVPGFGDDLVTLAPGSNARNQYEAVLKLLKHRGLASFHTGVVDAGQQWSGVGMPVSMPIVFFASDACTDPEPTAAQPFPRPHICGVVCGLYWRFPLTGDWLDRHITLTEASGPAIHQILTTRLFPNAVKVLATDATSAMAVGVHSAKRDDLMALDRCLAERQVDDSDAWMLHWRGYGNGLADLGSRDDMAGMRRLAAAFGITLTEIPIVPGDDVSKFMEDVLNATKPGFVHPAKLGLDVASACVSFDGSGRGSLRAQGFAALESPLDEAPKNRRQISTGFASVQSSPDRATPSSARLAGRADRSEQTSGCAALQVQPHAQPSPSSSKPKTRGGFKAVQSSPIPAALVRHASAAQRRQPHSGFDDDEVSSQALRDVALGSPQPSTAAKARAASTASISDALIADKSPYALCPDDPDRLRGMVGQVRQAKDAGIPKGTRGADDNGFKWAKAFGEATNTRWMRPRKGDPAVCEIVETYFTSLLLMFICQNIAASRRRQRKGYTKGQPTSAMQAIHGFQRVMRDCGRVVADNAMVASTLKGMCMRYKEIWGDDAFVREQAATFTLPMLKAIMRALEKCSVAGWGTTMCHAWLVMVAFLTSTGTRNNEMCEAFEGDSLVRRGSFTWVVKTDTGFNELVSSPEVTSTRKNGDYLKGKSAPSKCDRLHMEWGARDQWFRYDDTNPLNFAYQWQQWELRHPCPLESRQTWPAFSPTGNGSAFSTAQAARLFNVLLIHAIGAAAALTRTIHSFRATIASALSAARASGHDDIVDSVIQTLVRWKSVESLRHYDRMAPVYYANYVDIATKTDAGPTSHVDSPTIGPASTVDELEDTILLMSTGVSRANKDARPLASTRLADTMELPKFGGALSTFELAEGETVEGRLDDVWGIVGLQLQVPNTLWWPDDQSKQRTACVVRAFIGLHVFADKKKRHAYVITEVESGDHYVAQASFIASILDDKNKRRIAKLPAPKASIRK